MEILSPGKHPGKYGGTSRCDSNRGIDRTGPRRTASGQINRGMRFAQVTGVLARKCGESTELEGGGQGPSLKDVVWTEESSSEDLKGQQMGRPQRWETLRNNVSKSRTR